MRDRLRISATLLALALLGGCNRGPEGPTLQLELLQMAGQRLSSLGDAAPAARPPLTRAALDTITSAYIEVTVENRDALAYLSQQLVRQDSSPGQIVVWRSEDNATLALRSGVLVATRGLGDDLLSASAPVANGQGGPVTGGARRYQIRGLDNGSRSLVMGCTLVDLGAEQVEIVELRHATRHLQERCEGGSGAAGTLVVNDYWVDSGSGRVWKSRQWAGPTIGYLRIRQLTI
jgi:hypothetical protein